jgi:predicted dehydrogenase
MHDPHQASGRLFATGFVLRYAPLYRKVRGLLDEGLLGRVLSIDANENIAPDHGGYIMTNWRRQTGLAGPHVLEKCCHDLDLLNWFSNSLPARVASFGGRDFFVPSNAAMMTKYGERTFLGWDDPHRVPCPFTGGGDLMDNQVAIIEYRNGVRVQFQATMSNAIPERRMYFSCTEGTLIAELYSSTLTYRRLGEQELRSIPFGADGHGGGDAFIMKALFETMTHRTPPACSGEEGLFSAVLALAIDQAAREGRVIDLEPTWKQLGRAAASKP